MKVKIAIKINPRQKLDYVSLCAIAIRKVTCSSLSSSSRDPVEDAKLNNRSTHALLHKIGFHKTQCSGVE